MSQLANDIDSQLNMCSLRKVVFVNRRGQEPWWSLADVHGPACRWEKASEGQPLCPDRLSPSTRHTTTSKKKKSFSGLMESKLSTPLSIKSGRKQVNLITIPAQKHGEGSLMLVGVLWKAEPGRWVRVEEKQNTATFLLKSWSRAQRLC